MGREDTYTIMDHGIELLVRKTHSGELVQDAKGGGRMARRADDQRLQIVHLPLYFLHQSIKVHNVPRESKEGAERSYRILKKYLDSMRFAIMISPKLNCSALPLLPVTRIPQGRT